MDISYMDINMIESEAAAEPEDNRRRGNDRRCRQEIETTSRGVHGQAKSLGIEDIASDPVEGPNEF